MSRRRAARLLLLLTLALGIACTPTPPSSGQSIPAFYPPCIGSPCIVVNGTPLVDAALSGDGRIMATVRSTGVGAASTSTVSLVGIDDRWYRQVSVLHGTDPPQVLMTPDAEHLVIDTNDVPGAPADPGIGIQLYRRSTNTLTSVSTSGNWVLDGLSDDGRLLLAHDENGAGPWLFDLVAGTSQPIGRMRGALAISGDGRYLFYGQERIDLTDASSTPLPALEHIAVSGDGTRIAAAGSYGDAVFGFRYLDVGEPAITTLTTDPATDPFVSRDGRHLIGATYTGPLGFPTLVDLDLMAGTTSVIAANSRAIAVSANGNHVLYTVGVDAAARWSRP